MSDDLKRELDKARESMDYAWRNVREIDKARAEQKAALDAALAHVERLERALHDLRTVLALIAHAQPDGQIEVASLDLLRIHPDSQLEVSFDHERDAWVFKYIEPKESQDEVSQP